ncbi:MAG: acyl-CoA carboxylase subunit epsilon [Corynebacterium sp.]|nr:acyl-CoA carboxylase subunit epsilon [Corynebacterium sp.]
MSEDTTTSEVKKPFLTIVNGNPDDTQVAALTVLFATMANNAVNKEEERERNMWGSYDDRLRANSSYNPASFRNVSFY